MAERRHWAIMEPLALSAEPPTVAYRHVNLRDFPTEHALFEGLHVFFRLRSREFAFVDAKSDFLLLSFQHFTAGELLLVPLQEVGVLPMRLARRSADTASRRGR
jgi:hypothetical protein